MRGFRPDELERAVLACWEREGTFAESLRRRAGAETFAFYDGPPYATGAPHYGHLLQSALKDAVTRYWTMRGFRVDRRVGWDCHGLPVENLVEKELGIRTKREIEQKGIETFNARCRSVVLRHVNEFTALLRRFGRWADYDQAYFTMDAAFIESAWWVFKKAYERGLVSLGLRSSPYCPRCETPLSNFETALGYQDVTDPALTVKVPLTDEPSTFLLLWTTTPWTLPGNVAVAAHPDRRYVRVRYGDERWIIAKERLPELVFADHQVTVEDEFDGRALVGRTYEPLYTFLVPDKPAYRVVAAPFVSATEGTGLVHIAPAFGADDFRLAETEDLPLLPAVDTSGRFVPAVGPWAGQFVQDANASILADLKARDALVHVGTITHPYPHCWRCETPLIHLATTSWYLAVTKIKEQLLRNAETIRWVPAHLKEGRFGQGLRDAPDWAISRTRYWGTPLPVWICVACGQHTVVGSIADLEAAGGDRSLLRSPHADPDLHRPYVDRVVLRCRSCGGEARRVPEVLDVWFDSGSMPYGQWHYPFENKQLVEEAFPADFVGEALEMTRGWFYTLHVLAGALTLEDLGLGTHQPAFKNVVASGLILAEDGRKMSKSLGNYPDPSDLIAKYGADTLRLSLLTATTLGEDLRFSDRLVGELYRRFTLLLWNVWEYLRTYGVVNPKCEIRDPNVLDEWILARTAQLAADVQRSLEAYRIDDAARFLIPFVEDLSTWYVRRSRGREAALPVLREALRKFSVIAAPFIPFLAEHIHRELTGGRSPHLEDWPVSARAAAGLGPEGNQGLLEQMRVVRELASAGHRARAAAKLKVRQPLAEALIVGDFPALAATGDAGLALLRAELNVKNVIHGAKSEGSHWVWASVAGGEVGINTKLTAELKQEGIVRDLIRLVQDLRKQAKYQVDDEIVTAVVADSAEIRGALERFGALLCAETKSRQLVTNRGDVDASAEVKVADAAVWLGVKKG